MRTVTVFDLKTNILPTIPNISIIPTINKFQNLLNQTENVLFKTSALFPFDFFPDELGRFFSEIEEFGDGIFGPGLLFQEMFFNSLGDEMANLSFVGELEYLAVNMFRQANGDPLGIHTLVMINSNTRIMICQVRCSLVHSLLVQRIEPKKHAPEGSLKFPVS